MKSRLLLLLVKSCLAAAALVISPIAFGDEAAKRPQVGLILGASSEVSKPYADGFLSGMRELGYVDGRNVSIAVRYAEGQAARYPILVRELLARRVDILVVTTAAVRPAKEATRAVPIICPGLGSDPVREGLVVSLARPGGNLSGMYPLSTETDTKRLQLAIELIPNLTRAALLFEATDAGWVNDAENLRISARKSGVTLHLHGLHSLDDLRAALMQIDKERPQAVIVFPAPITNLGRNTILTTVGLTAPVISEGRDWADAGALLTFSADYVDMWRHSAKYVDKILKGAKVAELPVEQPDKFELIINLRAAKALNIVVPKSILSQADYVLR